MKRLRTGMWISLVCALLCCTAGLIFLEGYWVLAAAGLLMVFLILFLILDLTILKPVERGVETVMELDETEINRLGKLIPGSRNPFIRRLNLAVYKHETARRDPEGAEMFQKQTQLMALQSQINPHFLYNTLDTIRGQALLDNDRQVAVMVETLSNFFRYSISGKENMVMLRDEINHTINYMNIQKFRFGNRFLFDVVVDDEEESCMNLMVPRLILQPIAENAIAHGLEDMNEGGRIILDVTRVEDELILTVSDNGKGMTTAELDQLNARIHSHDRSIAGAGSTKKEHTGIALPNINRRIKLLFGDAYGMTIYSSLNRGTDIELLLPVIDGTKEDTDEKNHTESV